MRLPRCCTRACTNVQHDITQSNGPVYRHFRGTNRTRHFAHSGVCLSRVLHGIWWTRTIMPSRMSMRHRPKLRCSSLCRNITLQVPTTRIWPGINSKESPPCNYIRRYAVTFKKIRATNEFYRTRTWNIFNKISSKFPYVVMNFVLRIII